MLKFLALIKVLLYLVITIFKLELRLTVTTHMGLEKDSILDLGFVMASGQFLIETEGK